MEKIIFSSEDFHRTRINIALLYSVMHEMMKLLLVFNLPVNRMFFFFVLIFFSLW